MRELSREREKFPSWQDWETISELGTPERKLFRSESIIRDLHSPQSLWFTQCLRYSTFDITNYTQILLRQNPRGGGVQSLGYVKLLRRISIIHYIYLYNCWSESLGLGLNPISMDLNAMRGGILQIIFFKKI